MTAGKWLVPTAALTSLLDGTFDLDDDDFTVQLHTSASNIGPSSTTLAGVTNQVANANGYETGGHAVSLVITPEGADTVEITFDENPIWEAEGGDITTRWAVLGKISGPVLAYVLLDSTPADVTTTDGNTLTIRGTGSNGDPVVLTLSQPGD